jgi:D-lyxose ketol-isomerase
MILERILAQVESWGLVLPDVPPLVLDFGLGDFPTVGEAEFWIANETKDGYCGKFLFLFEGQTCPNHMHKAKLETFYIVKGRLLMTVDGDSNEMGPGEVLRMEPTRYHTFTALEHTLVLEVSKPSIVADNYFEDRRIPIGGNYHGNSG